MDTRWVESEKGVPPTQPRLKPVGGWASDDQAPFPRSSAMSPSASLFTSSSGHVHPSILALIQWVACQSYTLRLRV